MTFQKHLRILSIFHRLARCDCVVSYFISERNSVGGSQHFFVVFIVFLIFDGSVLVFETWVSSTQVLYIRILLPVFIRLFRYTTILRL